MERKKKKKKLMIPAKIYLKKNPLIKKRKKKKRNQSLSQDLKKKDQEQKVLKETNLYPNLVQLNPKKTPTLHPKPEAPQQVRCQEVVVGLSVTKKLVQERSLVISPCTQGKRKFSLLR